MHLKVLNIEVFFIFHGFAKMFRHKIIKLQGSVFQ
jgi:hypothetical protein